MSYFSNVLVRLKWTVARREALDRKWAKYYKDQRTYDVDCKLRKYPIMNKMESKLFVRHAHLCALESNLTVQYRGPFYWFTGVLTYMDNSGI